MPGPGHLVAALARCEPRLDCSRRSGCSETPDCSVFGRAHAHAELPVARRLRRGGRSRFPPDRGRGHGRGRLRRAGPAWAHQRADARHQLGAVRQHLRRLHGGLVPRARGVRLLPERRRLLLHRPDRRRLADAPGEGRAQRGQGRQLARLPGHRAGARPGRQRDQGRRDRGHGTRGRHVHPDRHRARARHRDLRGRHDQARQEQRRDRGQGALQAHPARGGRHGQRPRARARQGLHLARRRRRRQAGPPEPRGLRRRLRRPDRVRRPRGGRRHHDAAPSRT